MTRESLQSGGDVSPGWRRRRLSYRQPSASIIEQTQGALHLAEVHRFTNPAESAASLALREGKPKALDFYLDHDRVHVGDMAAMTADAFIVWVSDRAAGLDAIMLAPTRELVAELSRRARDYRLDHTSTSSEVRLADGNPATVGCDHHPPQRPPTPPPLPTGLKTATGGPSPASAGGVT